MKNGNRQQRKVAAKQTCAATGGRLTNGTAATATGLARYSVAHPLIKTLLIISTSAATAYLHRGMASNAKQI